ncbi:MAG: nuclear transcription factor Y subunit B-3-like protein [Piptocephalis tieghemiana]|nr:MAG: nuclear transcription factor Y subunit B-3-like protein [Piptocephalis tieghemiana]
MEPSVSQGGSGEEYEEVKEQDRFLPIANVARIMKRALPENAKIAKDAKETVQECVSEFISFITSEASDRCQQEKRKTINGEDILWSMGSLGFDNYAEALKIYLIQYRESAKMERAVAATAAAAASSTAAPTDAMAGVPIPQGAGHPQGQDVGAVGVQQAYAPHPPNPLGGGGYPGGGGAGGAGANPPQ